MINIELRWVQSDPELAQTPSYRSCFVILGLSEMRMRRRG